jgi:hypothetical protein
MKIDIRANEDMKNIVAEPGGSVENDVCVIIKDGVTAQQAHTALQSISSTLIGDQIKLT